MRTSEFKYRVPEVRENEFPRIKKEKGGLVYCNVGSDGEVQVVGNGEGLLYVARFFAAMGLLREAKRTSCAS